MTQEFTEHIDSWVKSTLDHPKNLATEIELKEQGKVALKAFLDNDADESGALDFGELKNLCQNMGLPMEDDEEEQLRKLDKDDSGTLDIEEWTRWWLFRIATLPNPIKQQEAIARNTFKKLDADGSGNLDCSEFKKLTISLGADFSEDELKEALEEIDEDRSGRIDIEEFIAWWTNRAASNRSNSAMAMKLKRLAAKAAQIFATDIFTATWNGDEGLVKAFVEAEKRNVHAQDASTYGGGWTALHYACYQGFANLVSILLEGGANVNKANDMGFTSLYYAAQRGHFDICETLLGVGADPTITGVHPTQENIFLCPVDHVVDYPELRSLFENHKKCVLLNPVESSKLSASLSLNGLLTVNIDTPQRNISGVPLKSWNVRLILGKEAGGAIELFAFAQQPSKNQSFEVMINPTQLKQVHSVMSPVLSLQVMPCNALMDGEFSEPPSEVQVILPKPKPPTPVLSSRSASKEELARTAAAAQEKMNPAPVSSDDIHDAIAKATMEAGAREKTRVRNSSGNRDSDRGAGADRSAKETPGAASRSRTARPPSSGTTPSVSSHNATAQGMPGPRRSQVPPLNSTN